VSKAAFNALITAAFITAVIGGGGAAVAWIWESWTVGIPVKLGVSVMAVGILLFGALNIIGLVTNFEGDGK